MQLEINNKLFSELLDHLASKYPENNALTCGEKTLTYKQLKEYADTVSTKLIRLGMKKNDKVILWGYNAIEWIGSFLGITQIGGVAVLMSYGLLAKDVSTFTRMTDGSFGLIGKNSVNKSNPREAIEALISGGIQKEKIFEFHDFSFDSAEEFTENDISLLKQAKQSVAPNDTQVIIFTSGTSSLPKAVQLSSYSILSNVEGFTDMVGSETSDTFCLALPLFHSYGMMMSIFYLSLGKHIFLSPVLKPDALVDMIAEHHIRDISSVCAVYNLMLDVPDFDKKIAGKMHMCIVGGSFTNPENMKLMEEKFAGARIIGGYGQSECSPVISVETFSDTLEMRMISVGHPLTNLDVRIQSEGRFLPQGETGEIVVKGPSLMNGYLGLPEEKQTIDKDGWLHTQDLGRYNEYGMLEFAGRIKDIIIRGGENMSPIEIEHAILSEPEVRDVKVLGCPHPIWGETVEACLVLKTSSFDEQDFRERLMQKLPPYKVPSHFVIYDSLPLKDNGKVDQQYLKEDLIKRLAELQETPAK